MKPYLTGILVFVGLGLLFAVWIFYEDRKRKRILLKRVRRIYGNPPEREYRSGDIENISHYFRRREEEGFVIDDITWNDLDLDRVYMMVNQTASSPGEDVLYSMMRRPLFSQKEVDDREALIGFFASHEREREQMQLMLFKVGKTRLGSLSDTVLALNDSPKVKPGLHIFMLVVLLASLLIVLPLNPVAGFFLFLVLMIGNTAIYYAGKDKKLLDTYAECISHLLRMLSVAEEMSTVKWPETKKQMDAIQEGKEAFAGISRKAFFLTSKNGDGDMLQAVLDYVRMITHVDILVYNRVLDEVKGKTDAIMKLIDSIGELDAAISIASFRELLSLKCSPRFVPWDKKSQISLKVQDLYHPLLEEAVANSVSIDGGTLVTGSNASGKSTFLKNVALNSILAQTICTCTCSDYEAPFLKVMTSMALRDDLLGGESYFIVEIKSLKRILEESRKEEPLLCIIDEVLRGTNTIERIAASSRILGALKKKWVLPFAASHDIELSYILDGIYENYHFEEEVREKEVVFSYILMEGRATSRNAIRLLDMLGYDQDIVENAKMAAESFERTGVWTPLDARREIS